jgi:putative transposase
VPIVVVEQPTQSQPQKSVKSRKPPPGKAQRIRVYPTPVQRETLAVWFGATRWTYNQAVELMAALPAGEPVTPKAIRDHCVSVDRLRELGHVGMLAVPYDVRDEGARDALKARASNLAKCKKHKATGQAAHKFQLKFRSRKAKQETITIRCRHWSRATGLFGQLFGARWCDMRASEPLPVDLAYDARLVRTRLGEYYLCVPTTLEYRDENQAPEPTLASVAALDPGVRTFMTVYSADAEVVEWGLGDTTRIHRLCVAFDRLQARARSTTITHRKRYRLVRAGLRIQAKIRRIVDEVHRKLAKWLCENFRVVLVPKFETQQMVTKGHRRLNSKTARAMCTWSHYRFRMHLHAKAREFPWCRIVDTTEEFTSKTCGLCGMVDGKLGGKKRYMCTSCGYDVDRDHNGARNILIRHISST